jgi:hypothetical protein
MSQHDYVIANGTGAAVRSDLNNALAAIVSNNSGATEPATMYAYQWWADTSTGLLKLRNAANNAWITLRELDGTLTIEAGTVSAPGLAFASDLNTGIYSPSADQLAIATNGVERVEWGTSEVVFNDGGTNYDFRIEGDTNANLFFVDASADAVGLGTSAPSTPLNVLSGAGTEGDATALSSEVFRIRRNTASDSGCIQSIIAGTAGAAILAFGDKDSSTIGRVEYDNSTNSLNFWANNSERFRCDSSGRLLVGTSTAPTVVGVTANHAFSVSSGNNAIGIVSDSLSNGNFASLVVVAVGRNAQIGIYKHSGITNNCAYLSLMEEDGDNAFVWTDNSGNLRISSDINHVGTTSGTVVGAQTSDERLKNILGPVEYGLAEIKQLDPVSYALKSDPEQVPHLGFIAQQVNPIIPESVFDTDDHIEGEPEDAPTKLGMEYVALIPVLVNAIKELSAEVDALKAQLQTS